MSPDYNPFRLTGKTILITGASSGIGQATAILCSKMGAQVILIGRNEERLSQSYSSLSGNGHQMIVADLTRENDIERICNSIPSVDGIVHCAGIGHRKPCKAITAEDISLVMKTNFDAAVLLQARLLSQKKVKKSASIVFVSSRTADVPTLANSLYSASKGAIKSYAQCLALELAPRGIRVNCICPAMVWTDLILQNEVTVDQLKESEKNYPLKRYGKPEDIANLAVYLLSDASSWMTNSCIDITGGGNSL